MNTTSTFRIITRRCGVLVLISVAAVLAFAAEPMSMMSKAEAKELIGKASTPQDHQRLADYFNHKAEMMETEAVEHDELAKEYTNNPGVHAMKHPMSGTTAAHCRYFAQAARKAAVEDRALATFHEQMAKRAQK